MIQVRTSARISPKMLPRILSSGPSGLFETSFFSHPVITDPRTSTARKIVEKPKKSASPLSAISFSQIKAACG